MRRIGERAKALIHLEDFPDYEVQDELACVSVLADAWAMAYAWPQDETHAWVVAAVFRPAIARALRDVTVH